MPLACAELKPKGDVAVAAVVATAACDAPLGWPTAAAVLKNMAEVTLMTALVMTGDVMVDESMVAPLNAGSL